MIVDTSALAAIVFKEPEHHVLVAKLAGSGPRGVGTPTIVECGILFTARLGVDARALLVRLLQEFEIAVVPFGDEHWRAAVGAFDRFGKGRHPAGLNFGDCFAYSVAHLSGEPLLCTGGDFAKTDLPLA